MLYVAYGSNMNKSQMRVRCPKAKPIGAGYLKGWRLVFRGVADIISDKDATCPVAIWDLTDECVKALDLYEGVPTLYERITLKNSKEKFITYVMLRNDYALPVTQYYDGIEQGYRDFFGKDFEKANPYLKEALLYTQQSKSTDGYGGHFPLRFARSQIKYPHSY